MAEAMQLGVFGPLVSHPQSHPPSDESDDDAEAEPDTEALQTSAIVPVPSPVTVTATVLVPVPVPVSIPVSIPDPVPVLSVPTAAPAPAPAVPPGADAENSRKRQGDRQSSLLNGSPAKRPRLSNGYENGVDAATTPMELDSQDHQGDNHAYPSPLEGEQAPSPPVLHTDGPQQGTQVDKVEELSSETTFMPLGSVLNDALALSRENGDNTPVLLHCQWHPQDPSILAAAGTDALARIWNVSRGAASDPVSDDHVINIVPDFHDLIDDDIPLKSTVTSMAWNQEGTAIAVATDSDSKARLTLWTPEGSHIHHFEVAEPPIIKLRWSPKSTGILAVAPDSGGTLITIYHAHTLNSLTYFLPSHDLTAEPLDATWTSDTEFLLCGGELLILLRYSERQISEVQKFEIRDGDTLTQVQYDPLCSLAATCGEKGIIDIWDHSGQRRCIEAHGDAVTALAWQPAKSLTPENQRLLASGGEDGVISIWNALIPDSAATYSMNMGSPIVALAFTPDGAFIAGATCEKILIWKVGDHRLPRATWSRLPHFGSLSPRVNSESDEEDEHCLCWDATGQKLAYGCSSRLAVITFR
ncbi:WD40-repeat-containing domain protein [Xylaria sp. CBS 124048]|nr:WD40-repeat-containing domain protein [Xylaria sp. CBS 124048]